MIVYYIIIVLCREMACCLPCFNCAITQAVRCASCYASAPYVHGETACTARAMKERRPVIQGIGVTDVTKIRPQSRQKWQLHRRGAHRRDNICSSGGEKASIASSASSAILNTTQAQLE